MIIALISDGQYPVYAIAEKKGEQTFFPALDFKKHANANKVGFQFSALYDRYAEGGKQILPSNLFHHANKQKNIYEFIKGRFRVLCFITDDGTTVILSHCVIKKRQKLSDQEIDRAVRARSLYEKAKRNKNLIIEELKEDEQ